MIVPGFPDLPGATPDAAGTNFALYSGDAERIELCLFDPDGRETARHTLPECSNGTWHGYLPGCVPGQLYGYRVHGPYDPAAGLRFNPYKLLLDPYARQLHGELTWKSAVFDYLPDPSNGELQLNRDDSAPFVPRSIVVADLPFRAKRPSPRVPWVDTVVYEANVRGYTMCHPAVPAADRGKFRGMRNGAILDHLKALGITAVELMPVQSFIDEQFLVQRGLRNLWGYNTIAFFAPANRYLGGEGIGAFREMVDAIHAAGMEVILDVAYNHTGEGNERGPALSFRGIDNLAYYRTEPGKGGVYINDTGCGNTLDADNPVVQRLVLDSLRYWHRQMDVDGFRFDLATVLGREQAGFAGNHPLLLAIAADAGLRNVKLIAEPWDPGPGGYQLGRFPRGWAEWNDRYRDTVRRYWRGDDDQCGEFARRLHGSADVFEASGRAPSASVNFITSHDGFTVADSVSYAERHNEANGEANLDGHAHNYSCNFGTEGPSVDEAIIAVRRTQRLNMLATLLFSQGTPMLLAGDELGNSQQGNNNAYAQDNAIGWLDWSGLDSDPEFCLTVRRLIQLRHASPLLRRNTWCHGRTQNPAGWSDIEWHRPSGGAMQPGDWHTARAFAMLLAATDTHTAANERAVALLINAGAVPVDFYLPAPLHASQWQVLFSSSAVEMALPGGEGVCLPPHSLAYLSLR